VFTGGAARETFVVAHRGAWGELPENSLGAFERAVEIGADMVELDVRRTAGRELIAYHDADVDGVPVARLRRDELTVKGGSARPPLLEEVLRALAGRIALDLELKERGCAAEVVALVARLGAERCLLSSFLDDAVRTAKQLAPELPTALLVASGSARDAFDRARRCGADHLALALELADRGTLAAAAAAALPCVVWTVNEEAELDRCLRDRAVVGVVSDRPGLALERRALL
jgi:glycerophosphoryl diester phosphodiesterase